MICCTALYNGNTNHEESKMWMWSQPSLRCQTNVCLKGLSKTTSHLGGLDLLHVTQTQTYIYIVLIWLMWVVNGYRK